MKKALLIIALFLSACSNATERQVTSVPNGIKVSSDSKHASESGIAVATDGRIFVVWSERDENKKYDIYVREYGDDLGPKSDPVHVNPNAGEARTWYGDAPSVLVAPDGKIYVAWNRVYPDGSLGNDLVLSTSNDGGKTFGEPLKINDDTAPASHGMHGMTLDADGRVLISWLDERYLKRSQARSQLNVGPPFHAMVFSQSPAVASKETEPEEPDAELYFATVADGKLEGPNRKIGTAICPCCRVSVASARDGSIYLAFRKVWDAQFRHISIVRSLDGGKTFSEPAQMSDDKWKLYACPVNGPAMRVSEKNELEIAWYSGGERAEKGLYRAISTDRGATFSAPALVSTAPVKGSPAFAGDSLVFASPEQVFLSTAGPARSLTDGTTPSAVAVGAKIIMVITKRTDESSSIWLVRSK